MLNKTPTLEDLKALSPQLAEKMPYLKMLVLFCSRATGHIHANSDWDFATLYDEKIRNEYIKDGWYWLDSIIEARRQGIISPELAAELAKSAGMRNILVHQYKDIDSRIVFAVIPKALEQYLLYVKQITAYIDSLEA